MAKDRAGSFLIGLTIGSAVGGILAFLMAPRPGGETREDLRAVGIELKQRAAALVGQAADIGREAVNEQRSRFQTAVAEGREAAAQTRTDLLNRYEKAKRPK